MENSCPCFFAFRVVSWWERLILPSRWRIFRCASVRSPIILALLFAISILAQLMPNSSEVRFDIENQRVLPSTWPDIKWDLDFLRVSFSLICVTFGRDEVDSQGTSVGALATNTPTFSHPYLPIKRYPDLNSLDTVENTSTCTGTTMVGDLNKYGFDRVLSAQDEGTFRNPLDKLRLSETQRRAISSCRQEVCEELSSNRDEKTYHNFLFSVADWMVVTRWTTLDLFHSSFVGQ